jgi:hypothetical protein
MTASGAAEPASQRELAPLPPQRLPTKAGFTDAAQPNRKPRTDGTMPNLPGWGDRPGTGLPGSGGGLPGWPGEGIPGGSGGWRGSRGGLPGGRGGPDDGIPGGSGGPKDFGGGLPGGRGGSGGAPDWIGPPGIPGDGGKSPAGGYGDPDGAGGKGSAPNGNGKGGRFSSPFGAGVGGIRGTGGAPVVKGPGGGMAAADDKTSKSNEPTVDPEGPTTDAGRQGQKEGQRQGNVIRNIFEKSSAYKSVINADLNKAWKGWKGGSMTGPEGGDEPGTPGDRRYELWKRFGDVPPPSSADSRGPLVSDPVGGAAAAASEASGGAGASKGPRGQSVANGTLANPVNSQMKGTGGGKSPIDPDPNAAGGPTAKSGFSNRLLDALQVFDPVPE